MPQPRTQQQSRTLASREIAGLALSETYYPPRLKMARHAHDPASFSLVLEGGYGETFSRKRFDCKPATVVFRPPSESHAVEFADSDVRIFRLDLRDDWLRRLLDCSPNLPPASDFNGGLHAWIGLRLYREFRAGDSFSPLAVEGLMLELLAESARSSPPRRADRNPPRWLERARQMLHERRGEALTLSVIAREVGVHPVHLAHEFRRHYGASAGEYARRLRVEMAARLVSESSLPLSQVAARAGFYDQSHFTNAFRRATGMTPTQYRAAFRAPQPRPN